MTDLEKDPLYDEAVKFIAQTRRASVSAIQRKFRIGYNRSARIVEKMVHEGIVSEPNYRGNREVLIPPPQDLTDQEIEQEIQEKGLTASRVTPDMIDALLAGVIYHVHIVPNTTTTIATAIMANGFTVATGTSACTSPENFDKALGEKIAMDNARKLARDKLWELEGYRLKRNLEDA